MSIRRHVAVTITAAAVVACVGGTVAAQEHTVTKVGIAPIQPYNGSCPTEVRFRATVFVSRHPVTIEYQWERSDGAKGQRQKIEIRSAGQEVDDTWTLGSNRERGTKTVWEKLHVLAPTGISSAPITAKITCHS